MDGADGSRASTASAACDWRRAGTDLNAIAGGHAVPCECDQALRAMLLMHKLFTVLVFGSECRWPVKPLAAASGRGSKKPPADARNQAARVASLGALVWRG